MGFKELRQAVKAEEFDYQLLMSHLTEYANKRDVVTRLIRNGNIVRIKKGLYIFGEGYRRGFVCKEALANQIYGPSYISLEYALSYYGLIPERVETITSVALGRSKKFHTPIGSFFYKHLSHEKYSLGFTLKTIDDFHSILIATPEKALLDIVYFSKGLNLKIPLEEYFYEDLRIEESTLKELYVNMLEEISRQFSHARISRVVKFIKSLKNYA